MHPTLAMPVRMRAYSGLAEEKYGLKVYPVVVNIMPTNIKASKKKKYYSKFMGLVAHQDYKVINLWEVDVDIVFKQKLNTLLPFVPIMKGGNSEQSLNKAVINLREDETIAEMEPMLAFFASFVLQSDVVRQIMRWDMAILRESPWYNELLQEGRTKGRAEGIEQGIEQGQKHTSLQMSLEILKRRFGALPYDVLTKIHKLTTEQLQKLVFIAIDAESVTAVSDYLAID